MSTTSVPWLRTPSMKAAASAGEESRMSLPTMTLGALTNAAKPAPSLREIASSISVG